MEQQEKYHMNKQQATLITGGIGHSSKMPCHTLGISSHKCITGSKLAKIPGTPCHVCYTFSGNYKWPIVERAHKNRFNRWYHPQYSKALSFLIDNASHFRHFDSGDIQSYFHLTKLNTLARNTPNTQYWLPTQEREIVKNLTNKARNLTIRVSSPMINQIPKPDHLSSMVLTVPMELPYYVTICRSKDQGNKCLDCRKCWDTSVLCVAYPEHHQTLLSVERK